MLRAEERKLEETHGQVDIQALQKLKNEKKELESEKKTIQKQLSTTTRKEYHKDKQKSNNLCAKRGRLTKT